MPIIVLSAVGEEEQKVRALEAGADDYVTKPFGSNELVARLRAALRRARAATADEPVLRADGLELDQTAHRVLVEEEEVHLTPTAFELLRTLMRNRGRLMTDRALLTEVWARRTSTTRRCSACISRTCAARSNPPAPRPATSSPTPASAIASRTRDRPSNLWG